MRVCSRERKIKEKHLKELEELKQKESSEEAKSAKKEEKTDTQAQSSSKLIKTVAKPDEDYNSLNKPYYDSKPPADANNANNSAPDS